MVFLSFAFELLLMLCVFARQKKINRDFALTYQELAVTVAAMTELTFLSADKSHVSNDREYSCAQKSCVLPLVQLSDDSH